MHDARSTGDRLEIPAELERLHDAREWAGRVAAAAGLGEEDRFQVKLATSEAVTNAIIHGSSGRSSHITLSASTEDGLLSFEVSDGGTTFTPGEEPVRLIEGGRGLDLVAMVMDEVQLIRREEGGLLRFAKRVDSA